MELDCHQNRVEILKSEILGGKTTIFASVTVEVGAAPQTHLGVNAILVIYIQSNRRNPPKTFVFTKMLDVGIGIKED